METLLQDLRFAGRTLLKRPAFTFIAVLTLALGIGANTAIFSVVSSVLLRALPFGNTERLAVIWASFPELAAKVGFPDKLPVSPGTFYDWKTAKSFDKMAMARADRMSLTGEGEPEMLGTVGVSGEFFQVLGTPALVGRTLLPADDESGKGKAVVLSHALWQRRFGGDPKAVGKTVRLSGQPYTVVGVMPPDFVFPRGAEIPRGYGFAAQPDIWIPMALSPEERQTRGNRGQFGIGLLKPGVELAKAQAELETISQRVQKNFPDEQGWGVRAEPLPAQLVGDIKPALLILLSAVGLVLLIACVNVANLLLAQAAARQKEIAVRTALGAGRGRMVRHLLTESALLSLVGGGLGLLIAFWGLKALSRWIPEDVPVSGELSLDLRILAFTAAVTLLTAVLAGFMPAFHMTRPDLAESLRDGTRAGSSTSRSGRMRSALVIVETAVAVLLVVGAGLLIRSFARLTDVDPGFRPEGVLTFQVLLPGTQYKERPQILAYTNNVLDRLRGLRGVDHVGMVSNIPMSGEENIEGIVIEGRPQPEPDQIPLGDFRRATPGYFKAMGIRLVKGRFFTEQDAEKAPLVTVIDQAMAKAYWPGEEPIGKRVRTGLFGEKEPDPWMTVVGVVENVRHSGLHVDPRPQFYVPQAQRPTVYQYYVLHAEGDPEALMREVRAAVFSVDRDQPIDQMRTMDQIVSGSVAGRRFNMVLLGIFAGLALVLAAVGIYGLTAYSVAQRTREMGLRMALGAEPGTVLRMVLREAGSLAGIGLLAGLIAAFAATRLMASLLFGVPATDPPTFGAVAVGLALVSLLAAYVPGRRATRVSPMIAMRND
ncbi:MAG TPA: ABC transporter permease [Thermoanaerobaculia bacterium]